jgi:hypothetical protein
VAFGLAVITVLTVGNRFKRSGPVVAFEVREIVWNTPSVSY